MAGIRMFEEQLQIMSPHTLNALQKLVMAMADLAKNAGKKTFFGRDKGQEAYAKFLSTLKVTIHSMILDGVITEATPSSQAVDTLEQKLKLFSMAFPNWQEAYGFAAVFFGQSRQDAVAAIERLRSSP